MNNSHNSTLYNHLGQTNFVWYFALLFLLILPPSAKAEYQVDSSQRLRFLNSATGQGDTSGNAFDARLSSTYNTTATANRSLVVREDAKARAQVAAQQSKVDSLVTTGFTDSDYQKRFDPNAKDETEEEEDIHGQNVGQKSMSFGRVDSSEREYQFERDKVFEEIERRRRELMLGPDEEDPEEEEQKEEKDEDSALANNPFYFKPNVSFEEDKYSLTNRLMHAANMEFEEAEDLLSRVNSVEEAIMELMEDEGFTYGEAKRIFQVANIEEL